MPKSVRKKGYTSSPRVVVRSSRKKTPKKSIISPRRFKLALFGIVFGSLGVAFLYAGFADSPTPIPRDNPSRGLFYAGLKPGSKGHCPNTFIDQTLVAATHTEACTHPDPSPEGVDISVRNSRVDSMLTEMGQFDATHGVTPSNSPQNTETLRGMDQPADVGSGGDLGIVSPRNWPCTGTGSDGYRVDMIYVYPSSSTNRLSALRPGLESIARRMNAVVYNSSVGSGNPLQIRFKTTSDCTHLIIPANSISGDFNSMDNIEGQLFFNYNYNASNRKYIVFADGGNKCGQGEIKNDTSSGSGNENNSGPMYAVIWHPCWNYAEPHEFMHTLGAVQTPSPYATPHHHCWDAHDVMCYNDGTGYSMVNFCPNTVNIWRYDCNKNTYFNAGNVLSGWLSDHWNTAHSRFLYSN